MHPVVTPLAATDQVVQVKGKVRCDVHRMLVVDNLNRRDQTSTLAFLTQGRQCPLQLR